VLEEGQQIYFGPSISAKSYFVDLGFTCPSAASTVDFLTSITNPVAFESNPNDARRAPKTTEDLTRAWQSSSQRAALVKEIQSHRDNSSTKQTTKPRAQLANHDSGYSLSIPSQITLCTKRGFRRLLNDLNPPISALVGNTIISIILGSMFYNMKNDTASLFGRSVLLFIIALLNFSLPAFEVGFISILAGNNTNLDSPE